MESFNAALWFSLFLPETSVVVTGSCFTGVAIVVVCTRAVPPNAGAGSAAIAGAPGIVV